MSKKSKSWILGIIIFILMVGTINLLKSGITSGWIDIYSNWQQSLIFLALMLIGYLIRILEIYIKNHFTKKEKK